MKRYLVSYRVIGQQTAWVEAENAKEAKIKAVTGKDFDPIDFCVLHNLPSTAKIETIEEASRETN
jgi:hypothetical protein